MIETNRREDRDGVQRALRQVESYLGETERQLASTPDAATAALTRAVRALADLTRQLAVQ